MKRKRGVLLFFIGLLGWALVIADDDSTLGDLRQWVRLVAS